MLYHLGDDLRDESYLLFALLDVAHRDSILVFIELRIKLQNVIVDKVSYFDLSRAVIEELALHIDPEVISNVFSSDFIVPFLEDVVCCSEQLSHQVYLHA